MLPRSVAKASVDERPLRTVLVVDDIPEIADVCRALFRRIPSVRTRVVAEFQSRRAIERMLTERFDLLLTDWRMPDYSGAAVVAAARATQPGLPIVVMSGHAEAAANVIPIGDVAAVVPKPLDIRGLLELAERLLAGRPGLEASHVLGSARGGLALSADHDPLTPPKEA